MKTNSKRRPKSTVFKGSQYDPVSYNDFRTVASYFPTIPPRRRHSSVRNFAFEKLPPLVELIPGGEALTRTRFGALFRQTLKTEQERWTGGVRFRSNEFKKLQLRKKAVRLILHSFEELTVCTDETRFLAVEFLDQLLDKTEIQLTEIAFRAAAAVSFRLACKIEEVNNVKSVFNDDFVQVIMAPDAMFEFTTETMCKWEISLLQCLNWQTTIPTVATFLSFFFHSTNLCISPILGRKIKIDAMKLAECCVLDSRTGVFRPSIKAACCFMLALRNNGIEDWHKTVDLIETGKENFNFELRTCISYVSVYWTSPAFKELLLTQSELSLAFTQGLKMSS